jgi:hypothetical protein
VVGEAKAPRRPAVPTPRRVASRRSWWAADGAGPDRRARATDATLDAAGAVCRGPVVAHSLDEQRDINDAKLKGEGVDIAGPTQRPGPQSRRHVQPRSRNAGPRRFLRHQ